MLEMFKSLEKYNYWSREADISLGYLRDAYLNRIAPYLGNRLIKVIVGQRRVGKSYLLRQIIYSLLKKKVNPRNIFYLNKELVDFDDVRNYMDLHKLIIFTKKRLKIRCKMYIFIDEVQNISEWEKVVNSLAQDHKDQYELFITGSNSTMLSGELADKLSGRYISFEMFPFSYAEYIDYYKLNKSKESYLNYLKSGTLPELFHLQEEETKRHYVSSLKDTVLLKDIVQRHQIKDAALLERVFLFLADNIGNLFSLNSIVSYLNSQGQKTNHETISNYVLYLEQSYLIHEASRYDIKGKRILAGEKKYYLNDLSFRNYLSSSFDFGLGKHLENAIFIYYKLSGHDVYVGTLSKAEVDFVVEKGDEKKYIQVVYSLEDPKVLAREFSSLESIRDSYEKMVISLDDSSFGNKEGVKHVCAWELGGE